MRIGLILTVVGAAMGSASIAHADVIYTVERETVVGGDGNFAFVPKHTIDYYNRTTLLPSTIITPAQVAAAIQAQNPGLNFQTSEVRLADISVGPNGSFLVAQGQGGPRGDPNTSTIGLGAVLSLQNVQTVPSISSRSSSGLLANPIGIAYDATTDSAVTVHNPTSGLQITPSTDGIVTANYTTGAQNLIFVEDRNAPRPRYQAGAYIQPDPRGLARTFVVSSIQGGLNVPVVTNTVGGPQLYRLTYDANLGNTVMSRIVDFTNPAETGVTEQFLDGVNDPTASGGIRGVAIVPGDANSVYVAMRWKGIWKVNLNNDGSFNSMQEIISVINPNSPLFNGLIEAMDYDPFANKLVFSLDTRLTPQGPADGVFNASVTALRGLWEMNLNGTGLSNLVRGVHVRGIDFIPSPGTAALLGLAGLVAARRRRA